MPSSKRRRLTWKLSRPVARIEALIHGVFFMACPRCGVSFGGHEWRTGHTMPHPSIPNRFKGICPPCAYEIGEALEGICAAEGHELSWSWSAEKTTTQREGRNVEQTGSFDLQMPPTEMHCARCFMEFDPLTHESIGRPL